MGHSRFWKDFKVVSGKVIYFKCSIENVIKKSCDLFEIKQSSVYEKKTDIPPILLESK